MRVCCWVLLASCFPCCWCCTNTVSLPPTLCFFAWLRCVAGLHPNRPLRADFGCGLRNRVQAHFSENLPASCHPKPGACVFNTPTAPTLSALHSNADGHSLMAASRNWARGNSFAERHANHGGRAGIYVGRLLTEIITNHVEPYRAQNRFSNQASLFSCS